MTEEDVPTEYVVEASEQSTRVDKLEQKVICKTPDDVEALIDEIDFGEIQGKVRITVERLGVMG